MAIDTLANVKIRLGISTSSDDTLLDALRDAADEWIENYCQRDFVAGTFTEDHPGHRAVVHLRNYPVASITSVRVDRAGNFGSETTIDASTYAIDRDRGLLWSISGRFSATPTINTVRVVYTTTAAVPADVKQAYALLVDHWYRHVKTIVAAEYQNVTQQTFGDTTAIFAKDQIAGLPLPPDVTRLLASHRNIPV